MTERIQSPEVSEQFMTNWVYFNFVRLAQTYGSKPEALRADTDIESDMKALKVEDIPPVDPKQKFKDVLSGIDYGQSNNVIELFYHSGKESAKIYITKGVKSGNTKMHTMKMFDRAHVERSNGAYVLDRKDIGTTRPNIYRIAGLLERAEEELKKQEEEKLKKRFDKPKLTIKQRIFRRARKLVEQ